MREDAVKEVHIQHVGLAGHEGSDADESESGEEDGGDWNTAENAYVTADGDILPKPSYLKAKQGESSTPNRMAGEEGPSRAQIEALAAQKRELSD